MCAVPQATGHFSSAQLLSDEKRGTPDSFSERHVVLHTVSPSVHLPRQSKSALHSGVRWQLRTMSQQTSRVHPSHSGLEWTAGRLRHALSAGGGTPPSPPPPPPPSPSSSFLQATTQTRPRTPSPTVSPRRSERMLNDRIS